jgi:hypothetical protein
MSVDAPPLPPRDFIFQFPPADRADSAEAEIVLRCGNTTPAGQVHDPCQHSTVQVLCCQCAGCMFDLWSCGQSPVADSYAWWEVHVLAETFDPWMRHPYALVLYALLIVFGLASQIIQTVIEIFLVAGLLMVGAAVYAIQALLF